MYRVDNQHSEHHRLGWAILIMLGIFIGACLGLYTAARTLPMAPQVEYYYLSK